MKIERKESNGLVEFGSLKCGDVFILESYGFVCIKTEKIRNDEEYGCVNHVCIEDGDYGYITDSQLVKPYPNAKLVLEG